MASYDYSSRDVVVAYGGQTLEGFAPDSFVSLSFNVDRTDEEVGADGNVAVSFTPDRTGACTLSFQQNSPANDILADVIAQQELRGKVVRANLTIADPSGAVFAELINCHIKTTPEVVLGSSASGQNRDWTFFAERVIFTSRSSNPQDAQRILSAVEQILTNI